MKIPQKGLFPGSLSKSWEFGILYKTKLVGDPETFTFGFMKLIDLMHPEDLLASQY